MDLSIKINDPDLIQEIEKVEEGSARDEFVIRALRMGVLALKAVSGQLDIQEIQSASDRLVADMESALRNYFDPENGKFDERVKRLVKEDGDIVLALKNCLVGEDSLLGSVLGENRDKFDQKMDQEFSLDTKGSALSRLVKEVTDSQQSISVEFSLDNKESALSRMLEALKKPLADEVEARVQFQKDLMERLGEKKGEKKTEMKTTLHGLEFEHQVCGFLGDWCGTSGDIGEETGNTTGEIKHSKVGDYVITIGEENKAAGAKIVIEAKEKKDYGMVKAKEEISVARKNRAASVGVMVMSAVTTSESVPEFNRDGFDIYLKWNAEDPSSDVVFRAGLSLAKAIAVYSSLSQSDSDIDKEKVMRSFLDIEKQVKSLEDLKRFSETILGASEKSLDKIRVMKSNLDKAVKDLEEELGRL